MNCSVFNVHPSRECSDFIYFVATIKQGHSADDSFSIGEVRGEVLHECRLPTITFTGASAFEFYSKY